MIGAATAIWFAAARSVARSSHPDEDSQNRDVGDINDSEFVGIYAPHWELTRFVVTGSGTTEQWLPHFPDHEFDRLRLDARGRHTLGKSYRMRLRGRRGPRGDFGHKGICCGRQNVCCRGVS